MPRLRALSLQRGRHLNEDRRRASAAPELADLDRTCLAESSPGTPCARPVDFPTTDPPPWPMCTGHALAAYRYVGQLVTDAVDVIAASPAIADLHATATTVPPVGVYYRTGR